MQQKTQTRLSNINLNSFASYVSTKDFQILRRTRELYALRNRLERYQKKLILEGLQLIKEFNLDIKLEEENSYVDINPLIEFAKARYPSLYSKYINLHKKYVDRLSNLEILLSE